MQLIDLRIRDRRGGDGTVGERVPVLFLPVEIRFSGRERKQPGGMYCVRTVEAASALGARLLRSYVPLRYSPSESGCDNNTCLPADTLPVRKIRISLPLQPPQFIFFFPHHLV